MTTIKKMATNKYLKFTKLLYYLISLRLILVESKVIQGILETKQNWAFLTRFCFTERGHLETEFEYESEYQIQNLLHYNDEERKNWKLAYKRNLNCTEKESMLNSTEIVRLTTEDQMNFTHSPNPGCRKTHIYSDGKFRYECNAGWTLISDRRTWWYLAISNCQSKKGLNIKYKILMHNQDLNDHWFAQFSADEFYIIHISLAFFVLYILLLIISLYVAHGLKQRRLFHPTFKLYLASVTCQTLGLMFLFVHYNEYANNGRGIVTLKILGRVLEAINSLVFIYLILLVSKGYTITRAKLSNKSRLRLTLFISLYTICFVILFVFEIVVFDPGEILYIYESLGGYGILILRFVAWLMLLYAVGFTLKHHPEKMTFYIPFLLIYSLWFVSGTIFVTIITYAIDNWLRERVATVLDLSVSFLGHLFFLILSWPTSANRNFPFHIKTTRVDAFEQFKNPDDLNDSRSVDMRYQLASIKTIESKQIDLPVDCDRCKSRNASGHRHSIHTLATATLSIYTITQLK